MAHNFGKNQIKNKLIKNKAYPAKMDINSLVYIRQGGLIKGNGTWEQNFEGSK